MSKSSWLIYGDRQAINLDQMASFFKIAKCDIRFLFGCNDAVDDVLYLDWVFESEKDRDECYQWIINPFLKKRDE